MWLGGACGTVCWTVNLGQDWDQYNPSTTGGMRESPPPQPTIHSTCAAVRSAAPCSPPCPYGPYRMQSATTCRTRASKQYEVSFGREPPSCHRVWGFVVVVVVVGGLLVTIFVSRYVA